MEKKEIIKKITQKKEFSKLPEKDVELAFLRFEKKQIGDEEKIRLTRELLHKVFGAFGSRKLLTLKDKDPEWILRKHLSTRERMPFYKKIYKRILNKLGREISIIDLGAGVNGFSYNYFQELGFNINYLAIESIGQFVDLMNYYFKKNKISGKAVHLSLFELKKLRELINKNDKQKPKVIFLFKTIDSLEMLKRDYSKKLITEMLGLSERIVISFPTESMVKRKKFRAQRSWILDFIRENFRILDEFEAGPEKFIVFCKKQNL